MANFIIKKASREDFQYAINWAENEGWNPGLDDRNTFYETDPDGFLVGIIDDQIIASISVVKYNDTFGFLGFYIAHPDYRGQGYGLQIWNEGMSYLNGTTIGLDGVLEQQENYNTSGFEFSGKTIRYTNISKQPRNHNIDFSIRPIHAVDHDWIKQLDHTCFGSERESFLTSWLSSQDKSRQSLAIFKNSEPMGFGTIRKCISGYKIGPLFATHHDAARELFEALCEIMPANSEITIDVPETNKQAVELAEAYGLEPVFETARMYRGTPPAINWQHVFGITTFELG